MLGFLGNIGPWEVAVILLVALLVVGPGKLPETAKSIGKAFKEFKNATNNIKKDLNDVINMDDDAKSVKEEIIEIKRQEMGFLPKENLEDNVEKKDD